jgi:hypothetical protein
MAEKKNPVHREEKCGTTKGWNAHQFNGEYQCDPCKQAKTDYTREWRRRTGRTKYTLVPINWETPLEQLIQMKHYREDDAA